MKNFLLLLLAISMLGCSSISVFTDHDSGVDFSKYKTFAYFKPGIDNVESQTLISVEFESIDLQCPKIVDESDMPDLL
jgi:hypothetical protein